MTSDNDPTLVRVEELAEDWDPYVIAESRRLAGEHAEKTVPRRYRHAVVDHPQVAAWVREVITRAVESARGRGFPVVGAGSSLSLLGPTGTGKTHLAYGAMRAFAVSGVRVRWEMTTAADIYARLRPRHKVDSEEEFRAIAYARLLVIDDLGAAKDSEWTEEINYRIINHRYEHELPTLITSNVPVKELKTQLGERVASRLREMSTRVALDGPDRRGLAA